jgi:hypothetical protein
VLSLNYGQYENQIEMFQTMSDIVDVPVAAQKQLFLAPWTKMEDEKLADSWRDILGRGWVSSKEV